MRTLLLNLLVALAWVMMTGEFVVSNFLAGFLLGYGVLWLEQSSTGSAEYFAKVPKVIGLIRFFMWELLKANIRVACEVITPRSYMRPGVIAIQLEVQSDAEITLLANLITLTPGTLSLDVSTDRRVLYVHSMYIDDVEEFRRQIKEGFERRIREVFE